MGRLRAWSLESRTRYAFVWGGINAATVCSVMIAVGFSEISFGRAVSIIALGLVLSVLSQGLIWYPRAKRKLTTRPG